MKRMQTARTGDGLLGRTHVPLKTTTGTHCPVTGWWIAARPNGEVVYVWKGEVMPGQTGRPAEWQLAKSDPGGWLISDMPDQAQMVHLLEKTYVSL